MLAVTVGVENAVVEGTNVHSESVTKVMRIAYIGEDQIFSLEKWLKPWLIMCGRGNYL